MLLTAISHLNNACAILRTNNQSQHLNDITCSKVAGRLTQEDGFRQETESNEKQNCGSIVKTAFWTAVRVPYDRQRTSISCR